VGHIACMGEARKSYTILVGQAEGKGLLEDLGVDRKIILD